MRTVGRLPRAKLGPRPIRSLDGGFIRRAWRAQQVTQPRAELSTAGDQDGTCSTLWFPGRRRLDVAQSMSIPTAPLSVGHPLMSFRGYRCTNVIGNTCIAVVSTALETVTATCSGSQLVTAQATFPDIITTTATSDSTEGIGTVTRDVTLFAPMFQLNFRSSDLPAETNTQSLLSSPRSRLYDPPSSATTSTTPSVVVVYESGAGALSTGGIIGVAVGAALGGVFLATVVAWLYIRRMRRVVLPGHGGNPLQHQYSARTELASDRDFSELAEHTTTELSANMGTELSGGGRTIAPMVELPVADDKFGYVHRGYA